MLVSRNTASGKGSRERCRKSSIPLPAIKHNSASHFKDWLEEFLKDQNVIGSELGVLDQLLWTEHIIKKSEVVIRPSIIKDNLMIPTLT